MHTAELFEIKLDEENLLIELLHAESEDDVIRILNDARLGLDTEGVWFPLGDNPGNFSTIGNQQEEGTAALVEKVVNSIDAVLLSECHGLGIDPESVDEAPSTMAQAVEQFMGVKEGRLDYLSATEQTEIMGFHGMRAELRGSPREGYSIPCHLAGPIRCSFPSPGVGQWQWTTCCCSTRFPA